MQFKKLNMTSKEEKIKKDEILVKGIVEIYKEILRGDRVRFPSGTWMRPDAIKNAVKCIKYLIEEKLKLTDNDIKEMVSDKFFTKNKLYGMLLQCFSSSPFKAIELTYPDRFKPWEFNNVGRRFWTKENAKESIKWLIEEKLKLSDKELKEQLSIKTFTENNLGGMLSICFNNSPYEAINATYPNKFKPWEFKSTPVKFWTKGNAVEAIRWLLEDKLKLNDEQIKKQFSIKLFKDNNLGGMLAICFNNSPYEAINNTYPNRFKPWEFKSVPVSYWNKERGVEATKWLVEEKLKLTDDELKEKLSSKLFCDYNLRGMLNVCFNDSPFEAINAAYPGKFKKEDFRGYNLNHRYKIN